VVPLRRQWMNYVTFVVLCWTITILVCCKVGLKSFVILVDYRDYMVSSLETWLLDRSFLHLNSYNLVSYVTLFSNYASRKGIFYFRPLDREGTVEIESEEESSWQASSHGGHHGRGHETSPKFAYFVIRCTILQTEGTETKWSFVWTHLGLPLGQETLGGDRHRAMVGCRSSATFDTDVRAKERGRERKGRLGISVTSTWSSARP